MSDDAPGQIKVKCACGTRLKLPAAAAGHKAKCPKCGNLFDVPTSAPRPKPAPAEKKPDGAQPVPGQQQQEKSSAPPAAPGVSKLEKVCAGCGASMPAEAVLCVVCGYNSETGRTLKAASAKKVALGGAVQRWTKGAGTFGLGCVLSLVGALVGAAVWSGVAIITNYEIGWIAWGLGALAGVGMVAGHGSKNARAGVAAAGIALVGIFAAKAAIFVYAAYPALTEVTNQMGALDTDVPTFLKHARLSGHRADLRAQRHGLPPDDARRDRLREQEFNKLSRLTDEELDAALAELDAWEAGGKWDDPAYVRNFLVYARVAETIEQQTAGHGDDKTDENDEEGQGATDPDEDTGADQEVDEDADAGGAVTRDSTRKATRVEWRMLQREVAREVAALSPEEQLEQAKEIDRQRNLDAKRQRLADHRTSLRAMSIGLSYEDEKRSELYGEELAKLKEASDEELTSAIDELDAWEAGGRWEDPEYVRNFLIDEHVREAIRDHREELAEDSYDETWEMPKEQWQTIRAAAVAKVDAIPRDQHVQQAKEREAQQLQRIQATLDTAKGEATQEFAGNVVRVFFEVSFDPIDTLFVIIAVASAFGIAAGFGED